MTRTDAIAIITATLPKLDDARVADLAELVQASIEPAEPFRDLTVAERAGLAAAAENFKTGKDTPFRERDCTDQGLLKSMCGGDAFTKACAQPKKDNAP